MTLQLLRHRLTAFVHQLRTEQLSKLDWSTLWYCLVAGLLARVENTMLFIQFVCEANVISECCHIFEVCFFFSCTKSPASTLRALATILSVQLGFILYLFIYYLFICACCSAAAWVCACVCVSAIACTFAVWQEQSAALQTANRYFI